MSSTCVTKTFRIDIPKQVPCQQFLLTVVRTTILHNPPQIKIFQYFYLPDQSPISSATTNWRGLSRNMNSSMIEVLFKVGYIDHHSVPYFFNDRLSLGSRSGGLWRGDISHWKCSCSWLQFNRTSNSFGHLCCRVPLVENERRYQHFYICVSDCKLIFSILNHFRDFCSGR